MRRLIIPLALAGSLAAPGCGSRHHAVRPAAPPPATVRAESATPEERPTIPINNGDSEVVKNWSTGGP